MYYILTSLSCIIILMVQSLDAVTAERDKLHTDLEAAQKAQEDLNAKVRQHLAGALVSIDISVQGSIRTDSTIE